MDAILEPEATITALGSMRLSIGGVEASLSSRKALAILVYLALQPGRSESRERVAALLWSDSGGEHGRAALRQALRRVKADLGPDGDLIDGDRSVLRLTRPVALDILEALEAAGRGEPPAALLRQDADLGRLFADLEDLDPDFNLWIAVQRERLTSQLISRLEGAIAACDADARRLALAEALMRIDPTHEGACRAAMHAHLALGDTAQAMRLYERLWKVLDEELDVEPSEKTQALYVAIKQGHARPISGAPEAQKAEAPLVPVAIVVAPAEAAMLPPEIAYFRTIFAAR
jgi:DNA-binding SARP family transcriptional activator